MQIRNSLYFKSRRIFWLTLFLLALLPLFPARTVLAECIGEHYTQDVNGVTIYYEETEGNGFPVILLHGNGGSHKDLYMETKQLSEAGYKVYAVDSRGQGQSSIPEEYHYADMADDVYELIKVWGLDKPALYGWSDGGIIGLLLEIRHPGTLSALAVSGANTDPDGLDGMFRFSAELFGGSGSLTAMIANEPHITEEELASIDIPVLVTAGENDMIKEEHTRMIAENIPGSELVILEGEDHGSYILGNTKMGDLLLEFLEKTCGKEDGTSSAG